MEKITFPAGTLSIPLNKISFLIAEAITPKEHASTIKITGIVKKVIPLEMNLDEEMIDGSCPIEDLTEEDCDFINYICELHSDLKPIWKGGVITDINLTEWELYEKVLKKHKPDWKLIVFSNSVLNIVTNKHLEHLSNEILKNSVVVHDAETHIPLVKPSKLTGFEKTYITLNEFTQYAKQFNLTVLVDENSLQNKNDQIVITPIKIIPVSKQQEFAILSWLKAKNINPKDLPKPDKGKSGVKKLCREELLKQTKLFSSSNVFDKAWERLRKDLEIQDGS